MGTRTNFSILLILAIFILPYMTTTITDFTVYPENKSLSQDFILRNGEIFYGAYYFTDALTSLEDKVNGVQVKPTLDVR